MGVIDSTAQANQDARNGNAPLRSLKIRCPECWDSTISNSLLGPNECRLCSYSPTPVSPAAQRIRDCVLEILARGKKIDNQLLDTARALANSSFAEPIPGEILQAHLHCDRRVLSDRMKQLRDDWHLPALAARQKPTGYYIATTAQGFLDWRRTTRAQAISELVTMYHLERTNFPELAGQQTLDFIAQVSSELQEAMR
jgi:hypothetical protein